MKPQNPTLRWMTKRRVTFSVEMVSGGMKPQNPTLRLDDKAKRIAEQEGRGGPRNGSPAVLFKGEGQDYEANNWVRLLRRSSSFTREERLTSSSLQYPSRRADTLSPTRVPRPELSI